MTTGVRTLLCAAAIVMVATAVLLALGRPAICTCGTVALWEPSAASERTSQMIADWYSASHIVHGLLFYALLRVAAPKAPVDQRFLIALAVEAAWEIAENTPAMIDRYRQATVALGYTGDSVLNSVSDIVMMALGFLAARRLPVPAAIALVAFLEIAALVAIRDNLALNIWMLLAPSDAIRAWQSG